MYDAINPNINNVSILSLTNMDQPVRDRPLFCPNCRNRRPDLPGSAKKWMCVLFNTKRAAGAAQPFLSDINDARLEFAKSVLPDIITINPKSDNAGDVVRSLTEGKVGCDVAIECVGNEHVLQACLDAVRKQGVVVQTGLHPHENPLDWFQVTFKDIDIRGSWAYPTHYWPRVIRLISSGLLPAKKIVTKKITLDRAVSQGFDALLDPGGEQIKILIDLAG